MANGPGTRFEGLREEDFPRRASIAEQLCFLLRYAVLAPSEHNTQPWLFRVVKQSIEIYVDVARVLPVIDPDRRALWISCGAACLNLRLAMHYFGLQELLEVLPEADNPNLVARLTVMLTDCEATWEEKQLFRAIPRRRSSREQFDPRQISLTLVASLITAAGNEGSWLSLVRKQERRQELADIILEADQRLWSDPAFRAELAPWLRNSEDRNLDGLSLPLTSTMLAQGPDTGQPSRARIYHISGGLESLEDTPELVLGAPALAIIGTFGDTPVDWFIAGQATERVLLKACSEGVQGSFVNQAIAIPALRSRLRATLHRSDYPQIVLRLGYGPTGPYTPRRPVTEMLLP